MTVGNFASISVERKVFAQAVVSFVLLH